MSQLVFVYGSLKRGLLHHDQIRRAVFVGEATLDGYALVLYEESYPALFVDSNGVSEVAGELFEVTTDQLVALDRFEEVPELYQRVEVTVRDGRRAWAYVVQPEVASRYARLHGPWLGRRD